MVRTKADRIPGGATGGKASGAKAPLKLSKTNTPIKKTSTAKGTNYSGGNPAHPRETPNWQKPITDFLNQSSTKESTKPTETQENCAGANNNVPEKQS